jgi:N-carbamoyl-L-amino-acid hydrolase
MPFAIAAYVELHIEQGPVLEQQGKWIGAVTGIQGLRWFEVAVRGRAAHAGTTPHASRQDALMAALGLIAELRQFAEDLGGEQARFTVGRMMVGPGSPNTVPDQVTFTIDLRHPDRDVLAAISQGIEHACRVPRNGCTTAMSVLLTSEPVAFDPRILDMVRLAAGARGYPCLDLVSGATHDAKHLSNLCPTGMIFIPCLGGVSHHEAESITPEDAAAGCEVLADVILELAGTPD